MKELLALQRTLVPELLTVLERRYVIMKTIFSLQPIGRRTLAHKLDFSERVVRSDTEFLREQQLIVSDANGMQLTCLGEEFLWKLSNLSIELQEFSELQTKLKNYLGIRDAIVVAGNSSFDEEVKDDIGRAAASYLQKHLTAKSKIAVSGGTTMLALAKCIKSKEKLTDMLVLPARGGLGERVELQANVIAARLAQALGGKYKLLHVPDYLTESTRQALLNDPFIQEVLKEIVNVNIVIHGISNASVMATQRRESSNILDILDKNRAVGEALGYYFDIRGNILTSGSSLGIAGENLMQVQLLMALAGGSKKADAIQSVVRGKANYVLITDEAAAQAILNT